MMTPRPEEIHHRFAAAFGSGDLETLAALYEDDATLVPQPGAIAHGLPAIRESLAAFLALKPRFVLHLEEVVEADDVALLLSRWTMTAAGPDGPIQLSGRTSDVVRRQDDGSWRLVIDHPYGGAR